MIQVSTIEQANERRIFRSIQTYMEGESGCTLNWIRGVIGPDIQLARQLLFARFSAYSHSPQFMRIDELLTELMPKI